MGGATGHWELLSLTKQAISQGIIPLAEEKCKRLFGLSEEQIKRVKEGKGYGVELVVGDNKQEKFKLLLKAENGKFWLCEANDLFKRKGFKAGVPFRLGYDGVECDQQHFEGCFGYPQPHQHYKIIFD